jgi:hypothetical protein
MKKSKLAATLLLGVVLTGCAAVQAKETPAAQGERLQQTEASDPAASEAAAEEAVRGLVEAFGRKLQMVSVLAPEDILRASMREHYADYVSPALLEAWLNDPESAPGRLTSSPWPDRIEVRSVEKKADDAYRVEGDIIETTSADGEPAAKRPVTLEVRNVDGRWRIVAVEMGAYEDGDQAESAVLVNERYGFRFALPDSWAGFTVVEDRWEGVTPEDASVKASGPILSIRHPEWTAEDPRQDIPIMIFTLDQWNALEQGEFHIGAAPVGPSELGRNNQYVFALPARYNYAFPTGYEEVEEILSGNPLQPFDAE